MNEMMKEEGYFPFYCAQDVREYVGFEIEDVVSDEDDLNAELVLKNKLSDERVYIRMDRALDGETLFARSQERGVEKPPKTITENDGFLGLPVHTQLLYFHLSRQADDNGFVSNPKKIQQMISACSDDLELLMWEHFILPFGSGIIVTEHCSIRDFMQNDRDQDAAAEQE